DTTQQLVDAIQTARPGDVLLLADGTYAGERAVVVEGKHGTQSRPIVIAAENQGAAVIGGSLQFVVRNSSHIVIRGLHFATTGEPAQGAAGVPRGAVVIQDSYRIRLTRNYFALHEERGSSRSKTWVHVNGKE